MIFLRIIYAVLQEVFSVIFVLVFYLFDQTRYDPKTVPESVQKPILLVHGYLHNSSVWWLLRSRLINDGYGPIFTINLGSPFKSMEHYLNRVESKIDQILSITGAEDVILIGHSMGGLLGGCFAANSPDKVRHVITLGSPMEGSVVAYLAFTKSGRKMIPKSSFMNEIQTKIEHASSVHFYHIGSTGDELVIPNQSTIPSYTPNSTRVCIPILGHLSHLISLKTFKEVSHALDGMNAKQV